MNTFDFFNIDERVSIKFLDAEKECEYFCLVKNIQDNSIVLEICDRDRKTSHFSSGTKLLTSGEGSNFNFDIPAKIVELLPPSTLKLEKVGLRAHLRMNVVVLLQYRKLTPKLL